MYIYGTKSLTLMTNYTNVYKYLKAFKNKTNRWKANDCRRKTYEPFIDMKYTCFCDKDILHNIIGCVVD